MEESSEILSDASSLLKLDPSLQDYHVQYEEQKTKRDLLLKLELTGDVKNQLDTVQTRLYNIDVPPHAFSSISKLPTRWRTTDELLYAEARTSYEKILKAFMKHPRIYKLNSIKEIVWKRSDLEREGRDFLDEDARSYNSTSQNSYRSDVSDRSNRSRRMKRRSSTSKMMESPRDIDVKTYIDPFVLGDMEEIWREKLNMLEKLTPREDLNGYEYREDYEEQQYRIALMNDYQERLKHEIFRRRFQPTLSEEVEDCLYDMVELVCTDIDNRTYRKKLKKKAKLKEIRHPATGSYRIKELDKKEGDDGQVVQPVSDMEFVDVIVTRGGFVLPKGIPLKVLLIHKHEREVMEELQRREIEERENMRRLPLTKKLRIAVLTNSDMASLIRSVVRDVVDTAVILPTQPYREKLDQILYATMKGLTVVSKDPNQAIELIRERFIRSYNDIITMAKRKKKSRKEKRQLQSSIEDIVDDAKRIQAENDAKLRSLSDKLREEERDLNMKMPIEIPTAISVTLTLEYEVPPAYKFRPRKTFTSEMEKLQRRAKVSMEENQVLLYEQYNRFVKKGEDAALQEYLQTKKELVKDRKKGLQLEETIPLRKLVGSHYYEGYLKPQDLVIKPQPSPMTDKEIKGENISVDATTHLPSLSVVPLKKIEMMYDDSERKAFEEQFLEEISYASCLPKSNITIEQIRRLEVNSHRLKENIEKKERKLQETIQQHQENQLKLALKRFIRKAESKVRNTV